MHKFAYYPGCTLSTTAAEMDRYARKAAEILGLELYDIDDWQCCGAMFPMGTDEVAPKLAVIRALATAKGMGMPLLTLCAACHHVFKQINHQVRTDAALMETVVKYDNELEYDGGTEVLHYIEALRDHVGFDALKEKVANTFAGKKIGAYYGCMLLRPGEVMQFDDVENPVVFEDFLRAIGAEPVVYPYRNECCGSLQALRNTDKVTKLTSTLASSAEKKGAEALVTSCPLCRYNIDEFSGGVLPVYYFTELLADALHRDEN